MNHKDMACRKSAAGTDLADNYCIGVPLKKIHSSYGNAI